MIIGLNDGPIGGNNGKNVEFYEFERGRGSSSNNTVTTTATTQRWRIVT